MIKLLVQTLLEMNSLNFAHNAHKKSLVPWFLSKLNKDTIFLRLHSFEIVEFKNEPVKLK